MDDWLGTSGFTIKGVGKEVDEMSALPRFYANVRPGFNQMN